MVKEKSKILMDWDDLILAIESMIEKEREHLDYLNSLNAPELMIKNSELRLSHYEIRCKEYILYRNNIK